MLALLFMASHLSLFIRARGKTSRLTANCPPIFSIWFANYHIRTVRAVESGICLDRDDPKLAATPTFCRRGVSVPQSSYAPVAARAENTLLKAAKNVNCGCAEIYSFCAGALKVITGNRNGGSGSQAPGIRRTGPMSCPCSQVWLLNPVTGSKIWVTHKTAFCKPENVMWPRITRCV